MVLVKHRYHHHHDRVSGSPGLTDFNVFAEPERGEEECRRVCLMDIDSGPAKQIVTRSGLL